MEASEIKDKIRHLLDTAINPAVMMHGGMIQLIEVKGTVVYIEMSGGCQGCGAADVTLKAGVDISGIVVNREGAGIAGAGIIVGQWIIQHRKLQPVTTTAADSGWPPTGCAQERRRVQSSFTSSVLPGPAFGIRGQATQADGTGEGSATVVVEALLDLVLVSILQLELGLLHVTGVDLIAEHVHVQRVAGREVPLVRREVRVAGQDVALAACAGCAAACTARTT